MDIMNKSRKALRILKRIMFIIISVIVAFLLVRAIGQAVNSRTLAGGINGSMYVDINGAKQWINIYGENINNPVLLYLHGGPGSATSDIDYTFTRKWADVYTVVTWDQRNIVVYVGHKDDDEKVQYFIKPEKGQVTSHHKDLDPAKIISKIEVQLKGIY